MNIMKLNSKSVIKKIVAIGGGEIRNIDFTSETRNIDKEIIRISGKRHPNLLFIPTASGDAVGYCNNILEYFGAELGCNVKFLLLYSENDISVIKEKIVSADIVYVGGGNTYRMMKRWRSLGVDKMLLEARESGTVMSGMSAGAICWFKYGTSDSWRFNNPDAKMIKVSGLGIVKAILSPHYSSERRREDYLKLLMSKTSGIAIALDDRCAIEIIGDEYRILSTTNNANAYKIFWSKGVFYKQLIEKCVKYKSINELLKKEV